MVSQTGRVTDLLGALGFGKPGEYDFAGISVSESIRLLQDTNRDESFFYFGHHRMDEIRRKNRRSALGGKPVV